MAAFGQLVCGPPGAGKSTYCHGLHQFLTALHRPIHIINLDPAVSSPPYPCSINITDLISLDEIMEEEKLGPNGGMLFAMEYLEKNIDWLEEEMGKIIEKEDKRQKGSTYFVIDTPGQVELWTNHGSLKRIVERFTKKDFRLAAVHLSDAHYITDASKYISVLLLSLRAMLQLELPHVNVLSKMDLINSYGELPFNLEYYTEVQDLDYLLDKLDEDAERVGGRGGERFRKMNRAICGMVEEFGLVSFETLAVEDKKSMLKLLKLLDKVVGYAYVPPASSSSDTHPSNSSSSLPSTQSHAQSHSHTNAHAQTHPDISSIPLRHLTDIGDISDVQERWVDRKEEYDEWEREGAKRRAEEERRRDARETTSGSKEMA